MAAAAMMINQQVRAAFESGITRSYEWRLGQVKAVSALLNEQEAAITKALRDDLGKSAFEANYTELDMVRNSCDYMVKELKRLMEPAKARLPWHLSMPGSKAEVVPEPLGAALIFSAWNFPFLLALDPLIAALAAGNAVVLKPSEVAPASSALLAQLIPTYLDSRAVKVVEGGVLESTALLNERWDKIFYTGCSRIGRLIMSAAAQHLTPVTLELGGKCPTIVDNTADLDLAARRIAAAKWTLNAGQACLAPDYVLVQSGVAEPLIEALKRALTEFGFSGSEFGKTAQDPSVKDVGSDTKEDATMPHIVNMSQYRRLRGMLDGAVEGMNDVLKHGGGGDEEKLWMEPTILLNPPLQSEVMNEEIFGPILPVVEIGSVGDAIAFVNSKPKPLALYLFTKHKAVVQEVSLRTSSGALLVNDVGTHFTLESIPFGGVGESGMGSYHGKYGFDTFSHKKPVVCAAAGDSPTRYPPYSKKDQTILTALFRHQHLKFFLVALGLKKA